jgi:hypothetical protein
MARLPNPDGQWTEQMMQPSNKFMLDLLNAVQRRAENDKREASERRRQAEADEREANERLHLYKEMVDDRTSVQIHVAAGRDGRGAYLRGVPGSRTDEKSMAAKKRRFMLRMTAD